MIRMPIAKLPSCGQEQQPRESCASPSHPGSSECLQGTYLYIYIYVYIHIYNMKKHIYIYIYIHIYIYIYICIYSFIFIFIRVFLVANVRLVCMAVKPNTTLELAAAVRQLSSCSAGCHAMSGDRAVCCTQGARRCSKPPKADIA